MPDSSIRKSQHRGHSMLQQSVGLMHWKLAIDGTWVAFSNHACDMPPTLCNPCNLCATNSRGVVQPCQEGGQLHLIMISAAIE